MAKSIQLRCSIQQKLNHLIEFRFGSKAPMAKLFPIKKNFRTVKRCIKQNKPPDAAETI